VGRSSRQLRLVGAVALCAALAGLAAGGTRASGGGGGDTCPNGDCLTLTVEPGTVSAGKEGLAVARFVNLGHTTLHKVEIGFATVGSTVEEVTTTFPGAECDEHECELGPVAPSASVTVFALFTAGVTGSVSARAEFEDDDVLTPADDDEGVTKQAGIVVSTHKTTAGDCLFADDPPLTSASKDRTQRVKVSFADPADGLPCTPVEASIALGSLAGFTEKVVSVEGLFDPSTFGTAVLDFATLPAGADYQSFVLLEFASDSSTAFLHTVVVAPCGPDGRPQSSDPSLSTDSCVAMRSPFMIAGARLTLHVLGTGQDPRYVG
jgi:hypothetical protein